LGLLLSNLDQLGLFGLYIQLDLLLLKLSQLGQYNQSDQIGLYNQLDLLLLKLLQLDLFGR
jgi:hypothetical protein